MKVYKFYLTKTSAKDVVIGEQIIRNPDLPNKTVSRNKTTIINSAGI